MQAAAASGALVSVNHPKPFGPAWEYPDAFGYHAIEVWNGRWPPLNYVALQWWEQHLRAGRRVVALGGSDTHRLAPSATPELRHADLLGCPTTWARVSEPSVDGVLAALRQGQAFISRDVDGPQVYVQREADAVRVRVVDAPGKALMLISERGIEASLTVRGSDWAEAFRAHHGLYVRAQVMDQDGLMLALSNPIYESL
jgi:hypothetical protein